MERISQLREALAAQSRAADAANLIAEIIESANGLPAEPLKRRGELDEATAMLLLAAEQTRSAVHRFHELEPLPTVADIIMRNK